jgi:hypothetical protein
MGLSRPVLELLYLYFYVYVLCGENAGQLVVNIQQPLHLNPLTPNHLERHPAVSPLKIKIPTKNMREKQKKIHQLFI